MYLKLCHFSSVYLIRKVLLNRKISQHFSIQNNIVMIVAQIKGMYSVNICPCADRKSHACLMLN